ncbi:MAG: formate dehydrogenase accessory protein FdhE [Pseudomonadota bacterium]
MPSQPSLEQIKSKVATVRRRHAAYGEVAAWMGDLLALTMRAQPPAPPLAQDQANPAPGPWFEEGRSLYSPLSPPPDLEPIRALLTSLAAKTAARKGGREQAAGLERLLALPDDDLRGVLGAVLASDPPAQETAAQELGLDPQVLNLFLRLAMRPSLLALAQAACQGLDLTLWTAGHCPVCGSSPRLASLAGQGGQRTLHCSLCETAWRFNRRQCPFCQTQEAEDLVVLLPEGEEGYRLDLCRRCGLYLKTLDLRSLTDPVVPLLDDLTTWHLDLVAQKYLAENPCKPQAS